MVPYLPYLPYTIYDRLTTIVQSCDPKREICQTFQIVPRRLVHPNERMNERTNERVEFVARRVAVRPFLVSKGEKSSKQSRTSAALDVYLTRSNLIKNLIKSDFWAASESVPNQPRRGNKTRKNFPSPSLARLWHPLRYINVSRVSNLTADFSPILVYARASREPIWNCNANNDESYKHTSR